MKADYTVVSSLALSQDVLLLTKTLPDLKSMNFFNSLYISLFSIILGAYYIDYTFAPKVKIEQVVGFINPPSIITEII